MEKRRVLITGLGTVNPLGHNAADTWQAVRDGVCGIGPITRYDCSAQKVHLAAEVKDWDPTTVLDKKDVRHMSRYTQLAAAAAKEALADSGLDREKEDLTRCGVDIAFWRVATRPGHPLAFGTRGRTVFFGVPGYPVSSMVCMEQFVLPALRRMMGQTRVFRRTVRARLAAPLRTNPGRTEFVRVTLAHDGERFVATPTGSQSSVVLTSMARADGFMVVPAACPGLAAGDEVSVQLFDSAGLQETTGYAE